MLVVKEGDPEGQGEEGVVGEVKEGFWDGMTGRELVYNLHLAENKFKIMLRWELIDPEFDLELGQIIEIFNLERSVPTEQIYVALSFFFEITFHKDGKIGLRKKVQVAQDILQVLLDAMGV